MKHFLRNLTLVTLLSMSKLGKIKRELITFSEPHFPFLSQPLLPPTNIFSKYWLTSSFLSTHQCSGSPTQFVWPTSAPCGVMLPCSSASSPQLSRSTSVSCPGRKTPSPSSQVRNVSMASLRTILNKQKHKLQSEPAPHPPFAMLPFLLKYTVTA